MQPNKTDMRKLFRKLFKRNKTEQNEKFLMSVGASTMQEILRNRDLRRIIEKKCPVLDTRLMRLGVNVRHIAREQNGGV